MLLVGHLILKLIQAKASFHKEINSCSTETSSNNSAIAARFKSKPFVARGEVVLAHLTVVCMVFMHLHSQY